MDNSHRIFVFDELLSDILWKFLDMMIVTTSKYLDDCLARNAQTIKEPRGIRTYVHDDLTLLSLLRNCLDNKVRNLPGLRISDQNIIIIMLVIIRLHHSVHSVRVYNLECPCFEHILVIKKCHTLDTFYEGVLVTSPQLTLISFSELIWCIYHTSTVWTHSCIIYFSIWLVIVIINLGNLLVLLGTTNMQSIMGSGATILKAWMRTPLHYGCVIANFAWLCGTPCSFRILNFL